MRLSFIVIGALLLAAGMLPARAQSGYDRPGSDYFSFKVANGDPAVCAARCEHEAHCRAWSFSYPRTKDVAAICTLKNKVTQRTEDACCVSGVRGAGVIERRRGGVEFGIDRIGGDYRFFDVPTQAAGASCGTACKADNRCRAWTYVRPGYISASARCYLMDKIKRPHRKPCCISGVVR
jgi:hypothetical protein